MKRTSVRLNYLRSPGLHFPWHCTALQTAVFCCLILWFPHVTSAQPGWKTFTGAWFEINYPPGYDAQASQMSKTAKGAESAFFRRKDGSVELYVFSPQRSGDARDIHPDSSKETVSVQEQKGPNGAVGRLVTISAKDGSYVRIYFENEEYGTKTITGLKCRDNATYREVKPLFEKFRRSLRQYADGAPDGK